MHTCAQRVKSLDNKGDQNNDHAAFEPAFDSKEVFFEDPCDVMTCDDMTCYSCHNQLDEDGSTWKFQRMSGYEGLLRSSNPHFAEFVCDGLKFKYKLDHLLASIEWHSMSLCEEKICQQAYLDFCMKSQHPTSGITSGHLVNILTSHWHFSWKTWVSLNQKQQNPDMLMQKWRQITQKCRHVPGWQIPMRPLINSRPRYVNWNWKEQDNQICPQDAASNNTEPGSPWWIQKSALERWCMVMNKCSTCHQKRMWKHYQRMMITQKLTHQNSGMIMEHKKCGPDPRTNILRILSLRVDWQTLDSSAQCSQNCWQRNHVSSNISMELLSFPTQRLHDLLCKGSNPALGVSGRGVQASTATHETQARWHHCHHGFHPMCHQAKKEPNSQPEILVV